MPSKSSRSRPASRTSLSEPTGSASLTATSMKPPSGAAGRLHSNGCTRRIGRVEPAFLPAAELAARIRRRELGARELLESYLARIEHFSELNAVVTLDAERALRLADEADAGPARSDSRRPLHGLPITIKDQFETEGLRTTCGAAVWAEHVPERDAVPVARLRAAGAIVFGKSNVPPLCADWQTDNELFGVTRNPWNLERTPGGSSGGGAAAVAAGLAPLAVGTDGGGSIRKPVAFCGIFGHKPTYGRIPIHPHGAAWSLSHVGPMTRTVRDAALMMNACAGPDPRDQYSLPADGVDYVRALAGDLKGLRV